MSAGDISVIVWLAACVAIALWQFATRLFAEQPRAREPQWERNTMSLFEATNKRLTCRVPEEVNE